MYNPMVIYRRGVRFIPILFNVLGLSSCIVNLIGHESRDSSNSLFNSTTNFSTPIPFRCYFLRKA